MKFKRVAAAWLVMFFIAEAAWAKPSAKRPLIVVRGPTVIAFFEPVSEAEAEGNEALYDFTFYASQVREPFKKKGIEFHEISAKSFRVQIGNQITTFKSGKIGSGYYLVAPGKKPHVEDGVLTDTDLLDVASKYFK